MRSQRLEELNALIQAVQGRFQGDDQPMVAIDRQAVGDGPGGAKVLTLSDDKRSMNIPISHEQLIVLCDALKSLVVKSDWNLNPLHPWETDEGAESAGPSAADSALIRH